MKKKILALFTAMVMLCGCSSNVPGDSGDKSDEPSAFPVEINGTSVESTPKKVVCLSPALTEILYEMGYGDTIVGISDYCDYPDDVIEKKTVGSSANPNIEEIIKLEPDLVLTSTALVAKDEYTMKLKNITTVTIPSPTSLESFRNEYEAIGLMFEGTFTGKETGEEAFAPISKICDNTDVTNIGSFIYITEENTIAGTDTIENAILSCFGTNAVTESGYIAAGKELSSLSPDIVLVNSKLKLSDIRKNKYIKALDTVKKELVIYVENSYFERPTSRISTLITELKNDYKTISDNPPEVTAETTAAKPDESAD